MPRLSPDRAGRLAADDSLRAFRVIDEANQLSTLRVLLIFCDVNEKFFAKQLCGKGLPRFLNLDCGLYFEKKIIHLRCSVRIARRPFVFADVVKEDHQDRFVPLSTLGGAFRRRCQAGRFRQIILNHQARRANRFFEFSARCVKSSNALRRGTGREQHAQTRGR